MMGYGAAWLFCIIAASFSCSAYAQGLGEMGFEERLHIYSNWANHLQARGRSLSQAASPLPAPTPPTTPPTPPSPSGLGSCKVLRYNAGFANLTLNYDKVIPNTLNFGECCKRCSDDTLCKAWTRVAGGTGSYAANFGNCYLKYDIKALDANLAAAQANNRGVSTAYPELRYVDEGLSDPAKPVILESGTKDDVYPAQYYGCPYQPTASTPCNAPATCNVNGNGQSIGPCIG